MLKEQKNTSQIAGEPARRWFFDENMDLIVWYDNKSNINGFQLCYDKTTTEHAITWTLKNGFSHEAIDGGEDSVFKNRSPILVQDGKAPVEYLVKTFKESSSDLDDEIKNYILDKLHLLKPDNR